MFILHVSEANAARTSLVGCTIDNHALSASVVGGGSGYTNGQGGGVWVYHLGAASVALVSFDDCVVYGNRGVRLGGGIGFRTFSGVSVHMRNVLVRGNVALEQGGGIWAEQFGFN